MLNVAPDDIASLPEFARQAEERIRRADRRAEERSTISGKAMAVFHEFKGSAAKLSLVDLVDGSGGGLGVRSHMPVEPGATAVLTPDNSLIPPQRALVVRCERDGSAYRIGLRTALALFAA